MRKCKDCQLFKNGSDSVKNCLSCSNSFSEPSDNTDGDILHCMEQNGKIVEESQLPHTVKVCGL